MARWDMHCSTTVEYCEPEFEHQALALAPFVLDISIYHVHNTTHREDQGY
jgi:hypothetical protein